MTLRHLNRLTVKQLQALIALDDFDTITKAAEGLGISQPALTSRLQEVERLTASKVFSRNRSRVNFTSLGLVLLNAARVIVDELTQAEQQLYVAGRGSRPKVRLAVRGYSLDRALSPLIARLHADANAPEVEVAIDTIRLPLEPLLDADVDIMLAAGRFKRHGVHLEHLFDDHLVGVVPVNHPLASKPYLVPSDFSIEPFVTTHAAIERAQEVELFFRPASYIPKTINCMGSSEYVCGAVAEGTGLSILSEWGVRQHYDQDQLALVPLTPNGIRSEWTIACRAGDQTVQSITEVMKVLKDLGRGYPSYL